MTIPGFGVGFERSRLLEAKAYAGDRDAVLVMLSERRIQLPHSGVPNLLGAWAMPVAVTEGLAVIDETDEAARLYPMVLNAINSGNLVLQFHSVHKTTGIAAASGGQCEMAEEMLGEV